jgi:hypothetical protein
MDNKTLHDSFGKIVPRAETKKRVYYEILRNYDKKGYVSNRRLHFMKQRFDRYVPAIAACLLLLFGISYFGVSSGLFTGKAFQSTDQMLRDAGYARTGDANLAEGAQEEITGEATAQDEAYVVEEGAGEAATEAAQQEESSAYAAAASQDTATVHFYAPQDIGYTHYIVEGVPLDPITVWEEMRKIGAVPEEIVLESYSMTEDSLLLYFNGTLQEIQSKSATTSLVTGIFVSYQELYPNLALEIFSGDSPILFQGEELDLSGISSQDLSVTDTKEYVWEAE